MKNTVAIIGATTPKGIYLSKVIASNSNPIILIGDDVDSLQSVVTDLKSLFTNNDIQSFECAREASWEADIIIITTSKEDIQKYSGMIKDVVIGKIIALIPMQDSEIDENIKFLFPHSKIVIGKLIGDKNFQFNGNTDAVESINEILETENI